MELNNKNKIAATIDCFPENARRRSTLKQICGKPPMWFAQGTTATDIKTTDVIGEALSATAIVPGYTNTLTWTDEVKEQEIWLFTIPGVDLEIAKFMLTHTLLHEYAHTLINPMWFCGNKRKYFLDVPGSTQYEGSAFMMMFADAASKHSPRSHYSSAYWPLPTDSTDPTFFSKVSEELCESVAAYLMGFIYCDDEKLSMDPFADQPMVFCYNCFMELKKVVTRFAPSPTGYFHAGSYRTALFSWIFARQNGGKFILRIEDTDRERSKKEYEENIIESLEWLGLKYDEFYRQSERVEIYKKHIQKLIETSHAYISKEVPQEGDAAGELRSEVIRFKNPNKKVSFNDLIRGPIEFDTTELGDFVIAKSMEEAVFHLVVVIDDLEMGVTHVIRGEDHISNTPRQILIWEALGAPIPLYAHIPLILAKDRSKLSKRNGAVAINEYRNKGYLADAVINYLALLGWHPSDEKELFSVDEIIKAFDLSRIQKGGAIFDEEKLLWYNRQYILKLSDEEFAASVSPFVPEWMTTHSPIFKRVLPLLREKIGKFADVHDLLSQSGELGFIKHIASFPQNLLLWKKNPDALVARTHLLKSIEHLQAITDDSFTAENIKQSLWPYAEAHGKGDVLWPIRVALTGKERSPDPFISAAILGKDESLKRLFAATTQLVS